MGTNVSPATLLPYYDPDTHLLFLSGKVPKHSAELSLSFSVRDGMAWEGYNLVVPRPCGRSFHHFVPFLSSHAAWVWDYMIPQSTFYYQFWILDIWFWDLILENWFLRFDPRELILEIWSLRFDSWNMIIDLIPGNSFDWLLRFNPWDLIDFWDFLTLVLSLDLREIRVYMHTSMLKTRTPISLKWTHLPLALLTR